MKTNLNTLPEIKINRGLLIHVKKWTENSFSVELLQGTPEKTVVPAERSQAGLRQKIAA